MYAYSLIHYKVVYVLEMEIYDFFQITVVMLLNILSSCLLICILFNVTSFMSSKFPFSYYVILGLLLLEVWTIYFDIQLFEKQLNNNISYK